MKLEVNGFNIWNIILVTFVASMILVFLVKKVAVQINAMDIPNKRKVHQKPIPRLGGLAIFLAFLIGYMFYGTISTQMISVLIGGFIIILTGIVDDINSVPARYKFFCQTVAATIVVVYGKLFFTNITILGFTLAFPNWINMILSIFFIVAIINAINLIDGLDGLASGISSIYFLTIAILGFVLNELGGLDIILSLIMLGSTLGFLFHNFPPAKIFMGDTGSMFLGFMISVIALLGYKVATITSVIIPIIILFIPIFDTVLAIIRRVLKRESIGTPDKEHLHHQLLKMTSSPTKTVLIIYFINAVFSAISILFVLGDNKQAIAIYILVMIFFLFLVLKTNILFDHNRSKNSKNIKSELSILIFIMKIKLQSLSFRKKIYIFGAPEHGNLGDQAIIYAERQFFKDNFKEYKIIELESYKISKCIDLLKKIVKTSPIFVHGGGFLGTIWEEEEKMFRTTIKSFPNNKIVVMPQTIFFSNDEKGRKTLEESQKIYSAHKNLLILCREKYSYDFMKENFPECNTILTPDMVLYLNLDLKKNTANKVLFCIRKDKEKINYNLQDAENYIKEKNMNIVYTDTVIPNRVKQHSRKQFLLKKLNEISNSKLVVTDRLHGMVFSLIAKTPCVVLENKSYKIKGVYNWIKNINYIKLSKEKNLIKDIEELLNINPIDNRENVKKEFKKLKEILVNKLEGEK